MYRNVYYTLFCSLRCLMLIFGCDLELFPPFSAGTSFDDTRGVDCDAYVIELCLFAASNSNITSECTVSRLTLLTIFAWNHMTRWMNVQFDWFPIFFENIANWHLFVELKMVLFSLKKKEIMESEGEDSLLNKIISITTQTFSFYNKGTKCICNKLIEPNAFSIHRKIPSIERFKCLNCFKIDNGNSAAATTQKTEV